jgi:RNA polymerase primary sigma factor
MPPRPDPPRRAAGAPHEPYFTEIDAVPLLDAGQERALAYRIAEGDPAARDHLVRANLRLVVAIARGYVGRGLDLPDLIAEGNFGLLRAVEAFDPSMNTRFGTYAGYWVRQSIKRALINTGKSIRIPAYAAQLLFDWRRASAELLESLGRPPTPEEVATRLRLPPRKLAIIREALRVHGVSAQGEAGAEGDSALSTLMDQTTQAPPRQVEGAEELRRVLAQVGRLGERKEAILRLRFGLDGGEPRTLAEVGVELGLTRERVRQLEKEALAELRARLGSDNP